jgi:hypothetical protein
VQWNVTGKIVAALEADWPNWRIWTVPRAIGGTIWCARRQDGTGPVLNADDPDELVQRLENAAGRER